MARPAVERLRTCLGAGAPEALSPEERDRWRAAFRAFRDVHRSEPVESLEDRQTVLSFLRAFPRASGIHRSQVESVLTFLMDQEAWAAASRSLDQEEEADASGGSPCQPESPGEASCVSGASSSCSSRGSGRASLERMVAGALEQHPDADALVPAALLELARNPRHVDALRVLAPKPQRFRTYVMKMLEANTPAQAPQAEPSAEPEPAVLKGLPGLQELLGLGGLRDLQQRLALCAGLDLSKTKYCLKRPP